MTQEEKAKAYDEALEIAKGLYAKDAPDSLHLERMFPQLKESEDEKMWKLIKKYAHYNISDMALEADHITREQLESWLEKQGEKKHSFGERENAYLDFAQSAIEFCYENNPLRKELITWLNSFKEGPQVYKTEDGEIITYSETDGYKLVPNFKVKYAGREYNVLEVKDVAGVAFYGIEDEPNHIDYVKAENCERVDGYNIKENGSLYPTKPAVFSEHKLAWSEEDERQWNNIFDVLDGHFELSEEGYKNAANWVKAIKGRVQSQNTWKPSDEQIKAVRLARNFVTDDFVEHPTLSEILKELEEQLKKLKEE